MIPPEAPSFTRTIPPEAPLFSQIIIIPFYDERCKNGKKLIQKLLLLLLLLLLL